MVGSDRTCTFLTTRSRFCPFFRASLSLGSTSERKGVSLTKEIVRKAKGEANVRRTKRQPGVDGGAGGRRKEKENTVREVERPEIQFERCMLDPLAGSAHFEIGYSFYCESGLHDERRALTAESRTRKEREGGEGRESRGKRKGPRVTCVGRNPSFFRSANTRGPPPPRPSCSPRVRPFSSISRLLLHCWYPSPFLPPFAATGHVRTEDSGSAQLMEVTKVEVVPSFKVAVADSRLSRARYAR